MYTIATLYQLRRLLALDAADTEDDDHLVAMLESASTMMERIAQRRFTPHIATQAHTIHLHNTRELVLRDDLLELTTLTNGDGTAIDQADVLLLPDPNNEPASIIRLINDAAFVYETTPHLAIQVAGIWGWHDHWQTAWIDSNDTIQDNPLTSTATTLTVSDADGVDDYGESPRFQVGHLLQIDAEYLRVIGVDATTNTLTIRRGVNGSIAAEHPTDTTISVYQPPYDLEMLCLRWANWLYREPDARLSNALPGTLLDGINLMKRVSVLS